LSDYATVIFIAPIWDSRIATPLKTFIKMEREHIKNYAFITVCSGRAGQHEKITQQLTQLAMKKPMIVTELIIKDLVPDRQQTKLGSFTNPHIKERDLENVTAEIQYFVNVIYRHTSELLGRQMRGADKLLV
jgi:multimeric flavodoxin WrbA